VSTNDRFVSWLRGAQPASGSLALNAAGHSVSVPVQQYGPGDVIGLSPSLIKTRAPLPDSIGFAPNLFPYIEFTQPDVPWWVTPANPDAASQLLPWLALIVVDASAGNPLGSAADAKLPVLNAQLSDLPPSAELAQWAHVQIASAGNADDTAFRAGTARILCPRALAPSTRYIACLVPVFEAGRLAGLGQTPPAALGAQTAWSNTTTAAVPLPVYDHWFFATGPSGDFETLARKLKGRDIAGTSSPLALNVSSVSGEVAGQLALFEGALRPVGAEAAWTGAAVHAAREQLGAWMTREASGSAAAPVIGPPIYGSIESGKTQVATGWSADLNLDPRRRAAAGLGAEIVRDQQDALVDEAWRQVGDLQKARREHAGSLLADMATLRLHARLVAPLTGANALLTLAPAARRVKDATAGTVAARLSASTLQSAALAGSFRRVVAAKMPVAARLAGQGVARTLPLANAKTVVPGAQPPTPSKLITDAQLQTAVLGHVLDINKIGGLNTRVSTLDTNLSTGGGAASGGVHLATGGLTVRGGGEVVTTGGATTGGATTGGGSTTTKTLGITVNLTASQIAILSTAAAQLDARQPAVIQVAAPQAFSWIAPAPPAVTASVRFQMRLNLSNTARLRSGWSIVATPRFQQALSAWLDPAFLMAGVNLPPDTAGLLEVNAPFVEALMVGANHELARELAWRGVPLDRASTLLTHFFTSTASQAPKDLPAIATWKDAEALGSHVAFGEKAVFVLRSRLVGHLTEALIYLSQAVPDGPYRMPGPNQLAPVFRGTAGVDTAYLGFEIAPEILGGSGQGADLGWYLVIQEIEGTPRFGFDEGTPDKLNTWNDAAWGLVGLTAPGGYVSLAAQKLAPATPANLVWGAGSAHMASITLQRPVRVSIHASLLLPPKT
jgi:hypothetical protein